MAEKQAEMFNKMIADHCKRLNLSPEWTNALKTLSDRFDTAKTEKAYAHYFEPGRIDDGSHSESDLLPVSEEVSDSFFQNPRLALIDLLGTLREDSIERANKMLFSTGISRHEIFYRRYRYVLDEPVYWDPLAEDLKDFLVRAHEAGKLVRRYKTQSPLFGDDVIAARVYSRLGFD
ncbi:hypothetical protein OAM69_03905 [bacterium]|nr:hypothetical protein [bacterium]